jgi:putative transposase
MKQVVQVRLDTTREQFRALSATLAACNNTANVVSAAAYAAGASHHRLHPRDLQAKTYAQARQAGLGSQAAVRCIKKVADAYTTLRANLKAGNYGENGSRRRAKAESRPVTFRPEAAQPFDDRNLSWDWASTDPRRGAVSIWTLEGRLKGVSFVGHPDQVALLRQYRKGETDLLIRGGAAYLIATLEVPEKPLNLGLHLANPGGWLGTDLGIANIATTSDGRKSAGKTVNRYRQRQVRLRARLQAKGTRSARRLLKKRARKEARFAADVNHQVSKEIVTEAERTGRGIALENLTGIRDRARLRKPQRIALHSWAFAQLGEFISYKARRAGMPVSFVDPAYTSQRCSACGAVDKKSRRNQAEYQCTSCGFVEHADVNAAINIASRAAGDWAAVNQPYAA